MAPNTKLFNLGVNSKIDIVIFGVGKFVKKTEISFATLVPSKDLMKHSENS